MTTHVAIAPVRVIVEPRDSDKERILARARLARDVLADLEEAALSASSRHDHQVDLLKAELAEANRRIEHAADVILQGVDDVTDAVDMTVGLDDVRAILADAANENAAIAEFMVDEDGEIQVIDSIHALVAGVGSLADETLVARGETAKVRAELRATIQAATDNEHAAAARWVEEQAALARSVRDLVVAIRPISSAAAEVAARANIGAAVDVIAQAVAELACQILDDGSATQKALMIERADRSTMEAQFFSIEAACEAAGMPATVERVDIPAWLAANLKPRAKAPKAKAPPVPGDEDFDDGTGWVVMRNDANGRRFYNAPVWGTLDGAAKHVTYVAAHDAKPRGAKVVGIVEAQRLIENDARIAASAELPMASEGGAE